MPISTPESLVPVYTKDGDHFSHVLNHLFIPAIKEASFSPILPKAQGADVIHAEIVKNLETADLVLCDISSLNPNVFFELGCRTALNKPVSYVMDDITHGIPFDTGIINHHTYKHLLAPWTLDAEIASLSAHIRASAERSEGKNMLWEYFGLQSSARATESKGEEQDRLAYLVMQVDAMKKRLDDQATFTTFPTTINYEPWIPLTNQGIYDYSALQTPDWDNIIAAAENDLRQISKLRKGNERPPSFNDVKSIIEGHVKSLKELIEAEPTSERAERARALQGSYSRLLLAK